jgi:hypothetical protein
VRAFAGHAAPAAADHSATHAPAQNKEGAHGTKQRLDIVVPDLYDSLEWCLTSPPPIHQFEEPPVRSCFVFLFWYNMVRVVDAGCDTLLS